MDREMDQDVEPKRASRAGKRRSGGAEGRRVWQRLVAGVLSGTGSLVGRLDRPAAMRLGAGLGRLAYRVARRQRRYADRNLRLAYGDALSAPDRDALVRAVFEHFGRTIVDFLRGPSLTPGALDRLVACDGWERVEAARAAGRGLILLTAHLGNWELLGRWLAARGLKLTVVAREPADPVLGGYLRAMREGAGFAVLDKGTSARELLGVLRRGEVVSLLPDQNSGDVFVPFFGVPAGTVAGPASLALHTGAALLPTYCVRQPDHTYRVEVLPPIPVEATGDRAADVARVTAEANRVLEAVVRRYPDQWLWLHNRWKSAFEERNRARWPAEHDYEAARRRWDGTL
jgi:KDO2-lipid IV(A) lauroyltransferase